MRSILMFVGMFVVGAAVGCADLLGIQPWEDKQNGQDGSGTGGGGGDPGDTTSSGSGSPSQCSNGMQDGAETGVDCGGDECVPCLNQFGCLTDADCASKYCPVSRGYCILDDGRAQCAVTVAESPTCGDCAKNGDETDVDCGGVCLPCRTGKMCMNDADCWSGTCTNGSCAAGKTGTRCFTNGDCAGATCAKMAEGCDFDTCCQ